MAGERLGLLSPSTIVAGAIAAFLVASGLVLAAQPYWPAPVRESPEDPLPTVAPSDLVACSGMPAFSPEALTSAGSNLEDVRTPEAAILRSSLYDSGLPQKGWTLVVDSPAKHAYVAHPGGPLAYAEAEVTLEDGIWKPAVAACNLVAAPPPGFEATTWRLASAPDPDTMEIHVFVQIRCIPPGSPADVVASIKVDPISIGIAAFERSSSPTAIDPVTRLCWCAREALTTIHLDEPLHGRDLFDAGVWPREQRSTDGRIVPPSS
jgi:hypothetical protein